MPRRPVDLPALELGARLEEPLLVRDVAHRSLPDGNAFTTLTLGNSTGTIPSEPFWPERQDEIVGLRRGQAVQVTGEVVAYRDRRQLRIISLRPLATDAVDVRALLPAVTGIDRYWETLDGWRREIRKPRLLAVVNLFYDEDAFRQRYEQCPGSVNDHHAAVGGLLQHTTEVAAIGRTMARAAGADQDLVLAGALLHDIGKIEAYRWDGAFDHTEAGRLVGHVTLGALMLQRRLDEEREPPCTDLERRILLHLVLSHHGRLEWGSPVRPLTLEAEVLHWADNASARTANVADALRDAAGVAADAFSAPVAKLDRRRLWRGTSDWGTQDSGQ